MAGSKTKALPQKKPGAAGKAAAPVPSAVSKLPSALAKRAQQQIAAKQKRLLKSARDDIALIRRRQAEIAEAFYDVGEALVRLKRPAVVEVIGRASFKDLCERDLGMSVATANRLITIVTQVPREDALRMGQQRSFALAELAGATPEADTAAQLDRTIRKLPSGKKIDLGKASSNEILAAAKELRRARPGGGRPRGRTTTQEERSRAASLQTALRAGGFERARVAAVATKTGQPADVRIQGIPIAELPALGRLVARSR